MTDSESERIEHLTDLIYDKSDKSFDRKLLADLLRIAHRNQFDQSRTETQSDIHKLITNYADAEDQMSEKDN